jgi:extradiol dioxygenase family protein
MQSLFHLAYHVRDLETARRFYCDVLRCVEGRSTETWLDVSFYGHQLSLHLGEPFAVTNTGRVGEHWVPMPHLGIILAMPDWEALAEHLQGFEQVEFVIAPTKRFVGEPGEQATMFFLDPFGNPIEIKGFADWESVYAK